MKSLPLPWYLKNEIFIAQKYMKEFIIYKSFNKGMIFDLRG
jgi:hypothetical protein